MVNFNVSLFGLNGHPHLCLHGAITPHDVRKMRTHVKMLLGDYLTYETKASQSGRSPNCRLCPSPAPVESLTHILVSCTATSHIRTKIFDQLEAILKSTKTLIDFDSIKMEPLVLEQFLLDPTSMSLKNSMGTF